MKRLITFCFPGYVDKDSMNNDSATVYRDIRNHFSEEEIFILNDYSSYDKIEEKIRNILNTSKNDIIIVSHSKFEWLAFLKEVQNQMFNGRLVYLFQPNYYRSIPIEPDGTIKYLEEIPEGFKLQ